MVSDLNSSETVVLAFLSLELAWKILTCFVWTVPKFCLKMLSTAGWRHGPLYKLKVSGQSRKMLRLKPGRNIRGIDTPRSL